MFNYRENGFPSSFFLTHMHIFNMYFFETGSPCVALAGLEITEIHLPYLPLCWDLKACVVMPT